MDKRFRCDAIGLAGGCTILLQLDAAPLLERVARTLAERHLDAVLIGNAAAALQGSPVTTLDLDVMAKIDGIRSFDRLRAAASPVAFDGHPILVASLRDIIKRKRAAGRPQDLAVIPVLEQTLDAQEKA